MQSGIVGNEWWKENLRMSRDTFTFICGKLRPFIEKQVFSCTIKPLFIVIIIIYMYMYRLPIFDLLFLWKRESL